MTLPELNRRLQATRLDALVIVPAALDPDATTSHFPERGRYPNGSRVRIVRGQVRVFDLAGIDFDVAVVLAPLPPDVLNEVRTRLLMRNGELFAPFAPEVQPCPT